MVRTENWTPYAGSGSIILAVVLLIVVGVLVYAATRLHYPVAARRPGKFVGVFLVVIFGLSVITFVVAVIVYALALYQQVGPITEPKDPITPVTMGSAVIVFFVILALTRSNGFLVAIGSAIVGTIAAPMIFELPFNLIVMWRTFPPHPAVLYTLLFFLPLFLVELSSFAMLALSPLMKLSRYTLFVLAGMFLIFAVWALFGFAYPSTAIPTALNMISKVLAFVTAVSLFVPQATQVSQEKFAEVAA